MTQPSDITIIYTTNGWGQAAVGAKLQATNRVPRYAPDMVASCDHVLRKDDDDWVKKCMEHEVEGSRPRGRPKKTWKEVVRDDCQARKLNKKDAIDRCKWRKMIREAR